jgi:hypothetical protein
MVDVVSRQQLIKIRVDALAIEQSKDLCIAVIDVGYEPTGTHSAWRSCFSACLEISLQDGSISALVLVHRRQDSVDILILKEIDVQRI